MKFTYLAITFVLYKFLFDHFQLQNNLILFLIILCVAGLAGIAINYFGENAPPLLKDIGWNLRVSSLVLITATLLFIGWLYFCDGK